MWAAVVETVPNLKTEMQTGRKCDVIPSRHYYNIGGVIILNEWRAEHFGLEAILKCRPQNFRDPIPPLSRIHANLSVVFVTYWVTPSPPQYGRHISIAPLCNLSEAGNSPFYLQITRSICALFIKKVTYRGIRISPSFLPKICHSQGFPERPRPEFQNLERSALRGSQAEHSRFTAGGEDTFRFWLRACSKGRMIKLSVALCLIIIIITQHSDFLVCGYIMSCRVMLWWNKRAMALKTWQHWFKKIGSNIWELQNWSTTIQMTGLLILTWISCLSALLQLVRCCINLTGTGVQFNRHLKFKAWVRAQVRGGSVV